MRIKIETKEIQQEVHPTELWNQKNLDFPTLTTYKANERDIDFEYLRNILDEGIQHFQDERFLRSEYEILSRIIYRMKDKFRTSKDFKFLTKVKQSLRNYYTISFNNYLKNFRGLLPWKSEDSDVYLPTKNTLHYILVRLQGIAKLLVRIVTTTKLAAELYHVRLKIGHFWKLGLIVFALLSRIYMIARYHTKFVCELYSKLFPFSLKLKNKGNQWLPKEYILPQDLKSWLNVDWIDRDPDIIEITEVPRTLDLLQLIEEDEDDIQFCNEYVLVKDDKESNDLASGLKKFSKNIKSENTLFRGFEIDNDIGDVIDLDKEDGLQNVIALLDSGDESDDGNIEDIEEIEPEMDDNAGFISFDSSQSCTKKKNKNVLKRKRTDSNDSIVFVKTTKTKKPVSTNLVASDDSVILLNDDSNKKSSNISIDNSVIVVENNGNPNFRHKNKRHRGKEQKLNQKIKKKVKHKSRYFGPKYNLA